MFVLWDPWEKRAAWENALSYLRIRLYTRGRVAAIDKNKDVNKLSKRDLAIFVSGERSVSWGFEGEDAVEVGFLGLQLLSNKGAALHEWATLYEWRKHQNFR